MKPLPKYAFISYYSDQFGPVDGEDKSFPYDLLYALAIESVKGHGLDAFWIDADCQPSSRSGDTEQEEVQRLINEDVSDMTQRTAIENTLQAADK